MYILDLKKQVQFYMQQLRKITLSSGRGLYDLVKKSLKGNLNFNKVFY